ncbi:MAG: hypothetical protein HC927_07180 [Deltaproteobacteria bacterium]|nr:hypothetical protein [Deltaproteobacteria bacterium]
MLFGLPGLFALGGEGLVAQLIADLAEVGGGVDDRDDAEGAGLHGASEGLGSLARRVDWLFWGELGELLLELGDLAGDVLVSGRGDLFWFCLRRGE